VPAQPTVAPPAATVGRGEPEGESESFLDKKKKELGQKREREREAAGVVAGPSPSTAAERSSGRRPGIPADTPSTATAADSTFVVAATVTTPTIDTESFKAQPVVATSGSGVAAKTDSVASSSPSAQIGSATSGGDVPSKTGAAAAAKTTAKAASVPVPQQPPVAAGAPSSTPVAPTSVSGVKRPAAAVNIPQFYFPNGVPSAAAGSDSGDALLRKVKEEFEKVEGGKVTKNQIGSIVKVIFTSRGL
jgi:hypothetical protein